LHSIFLWIIQTCDKSFRIDNPPRGLPTLAHMKHGSLWMFPLTTREGAETSWWWASPGDGETQSPSNWFSEMQDYQSHRHMTQLLPSESHTSRKLSESIKPVPVVFSYSLMRNAYSSLLRLLLIYLKHFAIYGHLVNSMDCEQTGLFHTSIKAFFIKPFLTRVCANIWHGLVLFLFTYVYVRCFLKCA